MQVLLKGLEFLYRHFDLLPEAQAIEMRQLILSSETDRYWRLLLHWSPAVRKFFLHLLIYRLRRPVCWTIPADPDTPVGGTAGTELPASLAANFTRRAARLRQIAVANSAGLVTTAAPPEAAHSTVVSSDADAGGGHRSRGPRGSGDPLVAAAVNVTAAVSGGRVGAREMLTGIVVPTHLHVYAASALRLYENLDAAQQYLEAEILELSTQASASTDGPAGGHWAVPDATERRSAPTLPTLRWDTSVLDIEEDRVIWVRESDLGQAVREGPSAPNVVHSLSGGAGGGAG